MNDNAASDVQLISRDRLKEKLGDPSISDSTLWRMVQRGELPRPIRISAGRVVWIVSEVETKIAQRIAERAA
jgi:predicted DNA-binding transcriptional regulator AlpA